MSSLNRRNTGKHEQSSEAQIVQQLLGRTFKNTPPAPPLEPGQSLQEYAAQRALTLSPHMGAVMLHAALQKELPNYIDLSTLRQQGTALRHTVEPTLRAIKEAVAKISWDAQHPGRKDPSDYDYFGDPNGRGQAFSSAIIADNVIALLGGDLNTPFSSVEIPGPDFVIGKATRDIPAATGLHFIDTRIQRKPVDTSASPDQYLGAISTYSLEVYLPGDRPYLK